MMDSRDWCEEDGLDDPMENLLEEQDKFCNENNENNNCVNPRNDTIIILDETDLPSPYPADRSSATDRDLSSATSCLTSPKQAEVHEQAVSSTSLSHCNGLSTPEDPPSRKPAELTIKREMQFNKSHNITLFICSGWTARLSRGLILFLLAIRAHFLGSVVLVNLPTTYVIEFRISKLLLSLLSICLIVGLICFIIAYFV